MPAHPSLQNLQDRLSDLHGVPIFEIPLIGPTGEPVGNNGDKLIRMGAEQLFRRCDLTFVDQPEQAQMLLMGGNGGMLQHYRVIPSIFQQYWSQFPDTPILMLPSTFYYPTERPTAGLPERSAPIELYCRESISYGHLLEDGKLPSCCRVALSHDTAFALVDTPFLSSLKNHRGKHLLIVERDDSEHSGRFTRPGTASRSRWRRYIPAVLKRPLYPLRAYLASQRMTAFRAQCEAIIQQQHPDLTDLPRLVRDISRKDYDSFSSFCDAIADAEVVLTTRLHVGILAALLRKKTYLFEGPYHKIRAIYEHSLAGYENVQFISDDNVASGCPKRS